MQFTTIDVHGQKHVVRKSTQLGTAVDAFTGEMKLTIQANYRGTGMAFCGILKKGQTLEQFIEQYLKKQKCHATK